MRVLVLHNSYQHRGGEDVAVEAEVDLLRAAGYEVAVEIISNDSISGFASKASALLNASFNRNRSLWAEERARDFRADIVHVHNFFPLLTPAVHHGAARAGAAVIQTLHNYRLMCANALFLRDGLVCEKCLKGGKIAALRHRCYRNSSIGSFGVTRMQNYATSSRAMGFVHRYIALTEFARSKFVAGGLPIEKISVKPNFAYRPTSQSRHLRSGALFVGRLSGEKGGDVLMHAWRSLPQVPLTVIGDGPDFKRLQMDAPANVRFLGKLAAREVLEHMERASCLVMPSVWYEGLPMTIVEAYAVGLPVVASALGSLTEIVQDGVSGKLFRPGDPAALCASVLDVVGEVSAHYNDGARQLYEKRYTPELNIKALAEIYASARAAVVESTTSGVDPYA